MYVPSTRKRISSYDVAFDEIFSSTLEYTSQPYAEAMASCPNVPYKPYATYSREQTGNVIRFTNFEEGGLLSETRDDAEIGDKYYDDQFDVSGSVSSGNECKSRSYMENVVYNCTLSYVKC